MRIYKVKPFRWTPRWINPIYGGADGWHGGYGFTWLGRLFMLRVPDSDK